MIIIAREELNRAASGLTESRREGFAFHRWLAAETPVRHDHDTDTAQGHEVRPAVDLYKSRLWRCE